MSLTSSHTLYAQLRSKAQTHEHESELYELSQLAGVTMDPEVFKIVLDLLEMKCSPRAIADVIQSMMKHSALNKSKSQDIGQGEPAHQGTWHDKNLSSQAHASSVSSSRSSFEGPQPASKSKSYIRSNTSPDQSRLSNITVRSRSGERQSQSPGSRTSSTLGSSRPHSHHDSSSYYLSRGENKGRPK